MTKGSLLRVPSFWLLLIGDLVVLGIFSYVGRISHHLETGVWHLLATGGPFLVGWLIAGWILGSFHPQRYLKPMGAVKWSVAQVLMGISLGLVIRAFWVARVPEASFAIITLSFNLVLFTLWRLLYRWILAAVPAFRADA